MGIITKQASACVGKLVRKAKSLSCRITDLAFGRQDSSVDVAGSKECDTDTRRDSVNMKVVETLETDEGRSLGGSRDIAQYANPMRKLSYFHHGDNMAATALTYMFLVLRQF